MKSTQNIVQPSGQSADRWLDARLVRVGSHSMTLRFSYLVNPRRPSPIYAGAFLYGAQQRAVEAGYTPVQIGARPQGEVDVTLTFPPEAFDSAYVVAFLMEAGKPVFLNGHFRLSYHWAGSVPGAAASSDKTAFCDTYAREAVNQFHFADRRRLRGIVPPVWSGDAGSHRAWCLHVDEGQARAGSQLRKDHLQRTAGVNFADTRFSELDLLPKSTPQMNIRLIRPSGGIQLDPGRGP